jgi:hypothetical protein
MGVSFTQSHTLRLKDPDAEATRKNIDVRIAELQDAIRDLLAAPGRYLGTTVITARTNYKPRPGTRTVRLDFIGGGGGGGGATPGTGVAAGAGGSSGIRRQIVIASGKELTGGLAIPGVGGAAGSTAPGPGGNGTASTIVIGGTTYTAEGGAGGPGMTGSPNTAAVLPVAPTLTVSGGIPSYGLGKPGEVAIGTGNEWHSGSGGGTELGAGGVSVGGNTAGNPGGAGAGGGGAGAAAQSSAKAGGKGTDGGFVIDEYT